MHLPLAANEARRTIRHILSQGEVTLSPHAREEMKKDGITMPDVEATLRGGAVYEAEWENRGWRHQVVAGNTTIVVEFESEDELVIVTAWKKRG